VREATGLGDTQLKIHLHRLVEMEYILAYPGGRSGSFLYELLYQGQGKDGGRFVLGLLDAERLALEYDRKRSGSETGWSGSVEDRSAPGRPPVGGWSAGGRDEEVAAAKEESTDSEPLKPKTAHQPPAARGSSYTQRPAAVALQAAGARD
jgi:hypothetical protein